MFLFLQVFLFLFVYDVWVKMKNEEFNFKPIVLFHFIRVRFTYILFFLSIRIRIITNVCLLSDDDEALLFKFKVNF